MVSTIFSIQLKGQDFVPPMDIPLFLSGNFGELRSNHFHTGIDIKTQGKSGIPVKSVAAGQVVRIKVSPGGYGNALYIRHANGYTSVYAHLSSFNETITTALRSQQYKVKSYAVDFFPESGALPVEQSEIIALSGNSGGSSGPHLHFELRDSKTEEPVNPLLFTFPIKDDIPPSIYGLMVYPLDNHSHVNGSNEEQNFACGGEFANYTLKNGVTIEANGNIGVGFHVVDRLNGYPNKCGFHHATLHENDSLVWEQKMDRLNFATNRYINSHMDYFLYKKKKKSYHRFFKQPNNELEIYGQFNAQSGGLKFEGGENNKYTLEVKDAYQNKSKFTFNIQGSATKKEFKDSKNFAWNKDHSIKEAGFSIFIPKNALYDNAYLSFEEKRHEDGSLNYLYIGNEEIPLHKNFEARIKMPNLPDSLFSKLYAKKYSEKTGKPYPSGGRGDEKTKELVIKSRNFGKYTYGLDTIAPEITQFTFSNGSSFTNFKTLGFVLKETESGIASYDLTIDGEWALLEYLPKRRKLVHTIDQARFGKGKKTIRLTLTDYRGNKRVYTREINLI